MSKINNDMFYVAYIFGFFALAMVANLFFALFVLPETKNKSLEQL